ncbi:MAG: glutamate-5-semialdehyde dehydrogenase, partial [Lysobacterales bacterium]
VFALCLKTRNACVLKGSSDASDSNQAAVELMHQVLADHGLDTAVLCLAPAGREHLAEILQAVGLIDLAIPRGSRTLIEYVRDHARIPVIETGAGIVHTYVDRSARLDEAAAIITNAKVRRVSVCNALDTLIVHRDLLLSLPSLLKTLGEEYAVEVFADEAAYAALEGRYAGPLMRATQEHFGQEFLAYRMSVKTVSGLTGALEHIRRFGSRHSEAIVAEDPEVIEQFLQQVDAAVVMANASTAFTDGAQFGMGAEIGISTQKLHARGPMALPELTTYKWVVRGSGQVRPMS